MKTTALVFLTALLLLAPALAADTTPARDVVATAVADGRFETLARALKAADLVDALRGAGPFTVFAPTDAAFAALPPGTLEGLLASPEALRRVLGNHVVAGRVMSGDLLRARDAKTLTGSRLPFGLRVADANVVQADIPCSNGVIHVVDGVLFPTPAPGETPAAKRAAPASADVMAMIHDAIDRGVPMFNAGDVEGCARIYEQTARALLETGDALAAMDRVELRGVVSHAAADARERAWQLRRAFDQIVANATFEPLMEASMPPGFPSPGPVGRVVTKRYPRYRAARAEGGNSFWTLFQHIKKNKVEMTAPVEMTMDGDLRARDMAFLYEGPNQGETGTQGRVRVLDLKPQKVLSIGLRGSRSDDTMRRAKAVLEKHLAEHGIEATGPYRVLGYNSPMVPAARQFWELQVPIAD